MSNQRSADGDETEQTAVTDIEPDDENQVVITDEIELGALDDLEQFIEFGEEEGKMRRRCRCNTDDGPIHIPSCSKLKSDTAYERQAGDFNQFSQPCLCIADDKGVPDDQAVAVDTADDSTLLHEYQDDSLFMDRYRGVECQELNIGLFQTYCGAAQLAMQRCGVVVLYGLSCCSCFVRSRPIHVFSDMHC
jgi:hypothetical protein